MKKLNFGQAFPDELKKVTSTHKHYHSDRDPRSWQEYIMTQKVQDEQLPLNSSELLKVLFSCGILILFFSLFLRLFHLQITEGAKNRQLADSNRIQIKVIHAPRGVIYDRNGKILAQNEPGFRLINHEHPGQTDYLNRVDALNLEVNNDPSLKDLEIDNLRSYPYQNLTAHILGYLSEIDAGELKNPQFVNYKSGDRIGRSGIEEIYEKTLRGIDGGEVIEIDAAGNKVRTLGKTDPIPGQNIYLTIDLDFQKYVTDKLQKQLSQSKSCCGAAIVADPTNGQILSLVSLPTFRPDNLEASFDQPNFPFLNRTIAGTYPPGSTFKIATALAGLDSGKITPATKVEDTGIMYIDTYQFANWYYSEYGRKEEGLLDVVRALQRSNDIFFYRLGQLAGEQTMAAQAKKLNFGQKLGIDLTGEVAGMIPTPQWKKDTIGEIWYPGDTLHMAIGQGYVLTTPLQISNLISTIATGGKQFPPHLGLKVTDPNGKLLKAYQYDPSHVNFKDADINLVKTGLEMVPKVGGTAWPLFNFPISTAGKTGTAEFGDPKNRTHAWYTGYAPANSPKIAATVLIEGGGEGSNVASPVVKEAFRWYLSPDKNNLIQDLYPTATTSGQLIGE